MSKNIELGRIGENLVINRLKKEGFSILDQNYKKQFGEIDIIASKKNLLIFVEVKMRKVSYFNMSFLIGPLKQKKIISVAKDYLARYDHSSKVCRFDIALIEGTKKNHTIQYIENAFVE